MDIVERPHPAAKKRAVLTFCIDEMGIGFWRAALFKKLG